MLFKWNYKPPTTEEKQAADELGAKLPSDSSTRSWPTLSTPSL